MGHAHDLRHTAKSPNKIPPATRARSQLQQLTAIDSTHKLPTLGQKQAAAAAAALSRMVAALGGVATVVDCLSLLRVRVLQTLNMLT